MNPPPLPVQTPRSARPSRRLLIPDDPLGRCYNQ